MGYTYKYYDVKATIDKFGKIVVEEFQVSTVSEVDSFYKISQKLTQIGFLDGYQILKVEMVRSKFKSN